MLSCPRRLLHYMAYPDSGRGLLPVNRSAVISSLSSICPLQKCQYASSCPLHLPSVSVHASYAPDPTPARSYLATPVSNIVAAGASSGYSYSHRSGFPLLSACRSAWSSHHKDMPFRGVALAVRDSLEWVSLHPACSARFLHRGVQQ